MAEMIEHLILTDPVYMPKDHPGLFDRLGMSLIRDVRDLPFLRLILSINVIVVPFALYLFLADSFAWWLAISYLVLVLGYFLGSFILMLHNISHRPFFKPHYRWMGQYINWVMGPLFGETPDTYFVHHIGMHHPENNLEEDLSCTMHFQRDSFIDFMRYFLRFLFGIVVELAMYMWKRGRTGLFRRVLVGELSYYVVVGILMWFNWQATLVVFIVPLVFTRFAMMTGNWSQHAFIDAAAPGNIYRNSITCINSLYNRRCFNDGYHIGHHLKATRHWTEMPGDFERNRETYAREGAIIFEKLDYFSIWFLLMTRQYNALARHYVDLRGEQPSREDIVSLLRGRTQKIVNVVTW